MKLYHHPISNNCRRVLIAAKLLGVDLELETVDLMSGKNREPAFLVLNPNGKVPTLVDGDTRLWESNAIIQYLAERSGDDDLFPHDELARADIARWQFWGAAHLGPNVDTLAFERGFRQKLGMGEPDAAAIENADAGARRFLAVLDESLAGRDFLLGNRLTLADISLGATLTYAEPAGLDLDAIPNVKAWRQRLEALEAFKACPAGP